MFSPRLFWRKADTAGFARARGFVLRVQRTNCMGNQRRYYPRQYEMGKRSAVGDFVQHTVVTRTCTATGIVHCRPDEVGRHVEIDDESFSGLTMADFSKVRDVLALQMAQLTPDLYRWSGVQEVG